MKHREPPPTMPDISPMIRDNIVELMSCTSHDDSEERIVEMLRKFSELSENDRYILCVYAELRSFRKMAKLLGASATTWRREIARIRRNFTK